MTSYALGVGTGVDMAELIAAVGSPSNVFNLTDWNSVLDVLSHVYCVIGKEDGRGRKRSSKRISSLYCLLL